MYNTNKMQKVMYVAIFFHWDISAITSAHECRPWLFKSRPKFLATTW